MARSIDAIKAFAIGNATISNSVKGIADADFGFSSQDLIDAVLATVSVFTAGIVFTRVASINPTATLGIPMGVGEKMTVLGRPDIRNLNFIRSGNDDAVVCIELER